MTIVQFKAEGIPNGSCWSDRLFSWFDYAVIRSKMQLHFGESGDYWDDRHPERIEAFLQDLFQKPDLRLIFVEKSVNYSNGYPCWHFHYFTETLKGQYDSIRR